MTKTKTSTSKLRGIVGNVIMIVFAALALSFLALPMVQTIGKNILTGEALPAEYGSSVFASMGELGSKGMPNNLTAALVFYLLLAIVACVVIVLGVISLVGAILGNKKLNMSIVNQALCVALTLLGLLGIIFTVLYVNKDLPASELVKISACAGAILPMCMGLFATVGAFVSPINKK